MKLTEMEQKCQQLCSIMDQLKLKENELQRFKTEETKAREDFQVRKILADIKGEAFEDEFKLEQLDKTKVEAEALRQSITKEEKEILEGMKQLVIDVLPNDIPLPDSEKKAILSFMNGPLPNVVTFIASTVNSELPLKLDNILLYQDKITVTGVNTRIEAAETLKNFVENVRRIAGIALKEHDVDVEETAKYFSESAYRDIWEAIGGRKTVSLQQIYSELHIAEEDKMQRARNFFTNTKIVLKEKYPFIVVEKGKYELSFFGALVWKQYQNSYLKNPQVEQKEKDQQAAIAEENAGKDSKQISEKTTLNNFVKDEKIQETIYGKKV
jgi:hypothetical protein